MTPHNSSGGKLVASVLLVVVGLVTLMTTWCGGGPKINAGLVFLSIIAMVIGVVLFVITRSKDSGRSSSDLDRRDDDPPWS